MIYRYFSEDGNGTLMLSDGEKREFTKAEWIDTENEPGIGQKISYNESANGVEIRVATDEDIEVAENTQKQAEKQEQSNQPFASAEECIEAYKSAGFRLVKDIENNGLRTISMRFYTNGDFGEAIISIRDGKMDIKETTNGHPVE